MINDRSNGKNTVRSVIIQDPYIYICVYTVMNFIDPDPDNSFELEQLPLKHIYIRVYFFNSRDKSIFFQYFRNRSVHGRRQMASSRITSSNKNVIIF